MIPAKKPSSARTTGASSYSFDSNRPVDCRPGCGACCIAPSISSAIPGMPHGKPAGVRCVQLDGDGRCRIFGLPERPAVCASLQPHAAMCGDSRAHALHWLAALERATQPAQIPHAARPPRPA